jgi:hypothetical protein
MDLNSGARDDSFSLELGRMDILLIANRPFDLTGRLWSDLIEIIAPPVFSSKRRFDRM